MLVKLALIPCKTQVVGQKLANIDIWQKYILNINNMQFAFRHKKAGHDNAVRFSQCIIALYFIKLDLI